MDQACGFQLQLQIHWICDKWGFEEFCHLKSEERRSFGENFASFSCVTYKNSPAENVVRV